MARRKSFTKKRRKLFLSELETHGNASKAARTIEISYRHMQRLRKEDDELKEEWEEAELFFLHGMAEDVADRGLNGENRQKITRKGNIDAEGNFGVTEEIREQTRIKSMAGALATLKARLPGFEERRKVELTGKDGGAIKTETDVDLSRLSDEELLAWHAMQKKVRLAENNGG